MDGAENLELGLGGAVASPGGGTDDPPLVVSLFDTCRDYLHEFTLLASANRAIRTYDSFIEESSFYGWGDQLFDANHNMRRVEAVIRSVAESHSCRSKRNQAILALAEAAKTSWQAYQRIWASRVSPDGNVVPDEELWQVWRAARVSTARVCLLVLDREVEQIQTMIEDALDEYPVLESV